MSNSKNPKKFNVLVACLNWGLGHATRSIPIIRALLKKDANVFLASDGRSLQLLQKESPQLNSIELNSYQIFYQEKGNFVFNMARQFPKIWYNIYKEHQLLKKIIQQHDIQVVISDNRYGLWSDKAQKSIFITHQLFVKMPSALKWLEPMVWQVNKWFIQQYDACWIPDFAGKDNLSGTLAHKKPLNKHFKFIGPLSRLRPDQSITAFERKILVVLSGPEPQRTILEKKLILQLKTLNQTALIVRGITETDQYQQLTPNIGLQDHLTADELNEKILSSEYVIARAGYSTVMDLVALDKKAILIPTPGQTEQEYLAKYLMEKQYFYSVTQKELQLKAALEVVSSYKPNNLRLLEPNKALETVIRELSLLK